MPLAFRLVRVASAVLVLACVGVIRAEEPPDHAIVAGVERLAKDGAKPDGRVLLGELNCAACHAIDASALVTTKQAPILDNVGSRAKVAWLRAFLAAPQTAKPGTTMPHALVGLGEAEREAAAEALVHFLATTGRVRDRSVDRRRVGDGETLYHQVGCAVCHGPRDGSPVPPGSVPLGDLAAKYAADGLSAFLKEPHKVRPSGRMPALNLEDAEAWAVANFLLKDQVTTARPSLAYRAFRGEWEKLPDFATLKPIRSGTASGLDLSVAPRRGGFALEFSGFLRVDRDSDYAFSLTSDDGSKLWIDGVQVAESDGVHPAQTGNGEVFLKKGFHKIVVGYFDAGGETELAVEFEGLDLPKQSVEPFLSLTDEPPPASAKADEFVARPELAAKGKAYFASLGCASCHQLARDGTRIETEVRSVPLAGARVDRGCLAESPPPKSPKYALNAAQRDALADAIRSLSGEPPKPDDKAVIAHAMTTFNCYACHARDGVGGVEPARETQFVTTYADLGDEGRIPPRLDGVGAKLSARWLDHILGDGSKDRPYMKTRMPRFGADNVGHLAARFQAADPIAPVPEPTFDLPEKKVKAIGRHLAGTQAFGCVQCHTFRQIPSAGIPAIDMSLMTRRLRRKWFLSYVVNPQAYRPGTRMPSAWPNKESQLGDILGGDSRAQIEAVWAFLSDGDRASPPYGIGRSPIVLAPEAEAIVYRGFIEGAGTRGIAVGFPEKAHLAFDANEGRVALIWKNAFFDASKHWVGRGEGTQPPLGDEIIAMPRGPDLARLDRPDRPWPGGDDPASGFRFRGYRLDAKGHPTFHYDVAGARVADTPSALVIDGSPALRRTIVVEGDAKTLSLRAASGRRIEVKGDGWFAIDGEWSTKIEGGGTPTIRASGGHSELIVPLGDREAATLIQTYRW